MNKQYEKWLDEQLKKTIDSGKVEFDSEKWKQKYLAEYQVLISRNARQAKSPRFLWARPLVRVAAVVAIMALVIFIALHRPSKRVEMAVAEKPQQSPAVMMSRLSLMLAYERGGLDAVDEQCKKAFKLLGQKTTKISINELLNENNGI